MRSVIITSVVVALHGMVLMPWGNAAPDVIPPKTSVVRVSMVQGAAVSKPVVQPVQPAPVASAPAISKNKITPRKAEKPVKQPVQETQEQPAELAHKGNAEQSVVTDPAPADYAQNPPPAYPREAMARKLQGVVYLEVWVKEDGVVKQLAVHRSSGHKVLDEAAAKAVRQWRFVPARMGDKTVEGRVIVPVAFKLQ